MLDITVEFKGLSDIEAGLQALPVELQRKALREGLTAAAKVFKIGMSRRAPEDTGELASSITYRVRVSERGYGQAIAQIGPAKNAWYGSFLERGTKYMRARKFMVTTMEEDGQIALSAFVHGVRRNFDRLIRRARRAA